MNCAACGSIMRTLVSSKVRQSHPPFRSSRRHISNAGIALGIEGIEGLVQTRRRGLPGVDRAADLGNLHSGAHS